MADFRSIYHSSQKKQINVTEMDRFDNDRVQFLIDKVVGHTDEPTIYSIRGDIIHKAAEVHYEKAMNGLKSNINYIISNIIKNLPEKQRKIAETLNIYELQDTAKQMINFAFTGQKIIGSEIPFIIYIDMATGKTITRKKGDPAPSGNYEEIHGKMDLVVAPDATNLGEIVVQDFKTGRVKGMEELSESWQRKAYAVAAKELFGAKKVKFQYIFPDQTGVQVKEFVADADTIENFKSQLPNQAGAMIGFEIPEGYRPKGSNTKTPLMDNLSKELVKLQSQKASPQKIKQVIRSFVGGMFTKEIPTLIKEERYFEMVESYLLEMYEEAHSKIGYKGSSLIKPSENKSVTPDALERKRLNEGESTYGDISKSIREFDYFFKSKYLRPFEGKFVTVSDLMELQSTTSIINSDFKREFKKSLKYFMEVSGASVENAILGEFAYTSGEKKQKNIISAQHIYKVAKRENQKILSSLDEFQKDNPNAAYHIKNGFNISGESTEVSYKISDDLVSFETKYKDNYLKSVLNEVQFRQAKVLARVQKIALKEFHKWLTSKGKRLTQYVTMDFETAGLDIKQSEISTVAITVRDALFNIIDKKYIEFKLSKPLVKEITQQSKRGDWNRGVTFEEGKQIVADFLSDAAKRGNLIPVGHNFRQFDSFLVKRLVESEQYRDWFFAAKMPPNVKKLYKKLKNKGWTHDQILKYLKDKNDPDVQNITLLDKIIDTLEGSRGVRLGGGSNALEELTKNLGLNFSDIKRIAMDKLNIDPKTIGQHHAAYDVAATELVFQEIINAFIQSGGPSISSLKRRAHSGIKQLGSGRTGEREILANVDKGGTADFGLLGSSNVAGKPTTVFTNLFTFMDDAGLVEEKPIKSNKMHVAGVTTNKFIVEEQKYIERKRKLDRSIRDTINKIAEFADKHPKINLGRKKSINITGEQVKHWIYVIRGAEKGELSDENYAALTILMFKMRELGKFNEMAVKSVFEELLSREKEDKVMESDFDTKKQSGKILKSINIISPKDALR